MKRKSKSSDHIADVTQKVNASPPKTFAAGSMLDIATLVKDPALWAAIQLTRPMGAPPQTVGDAIDMIRPIVQKAIDQAEKNRRVTCPGCQTTLHDGARERGICTACAAILVSSKKLNKKCPECGQLAPHGGIHSNAGGTLCPMVYGRRGWRQLGEYDT